jgi:hypothetical protein
VGMAEPLASAVRRLSGSLRGKHLQLSKLAMSLERRPIFATLAMSTPSIIFEPQLQPHKASLAFFPTTLGRITKLFWFVAASCQSFHSTSTRLFSDVLELPFGAWDFWLTLLFLRDCCDCLASGCPYCCNSTRTARHNRFICCLRRHYVLYHDFMRPIHVLCPFLKHEVHHHSLAELCILQHWMPTLHQYEVRMETRFTLSGDYRKTRPGRHQWHVVFLPAVVYLSPLRLRMDRLLRLCLCYVRHAVDRSLHGIEVQGYRSKARLGPKVYSRESHLCSPTLRICAACFFACSTFATYRNHS